MIISLLLLSLASVAPASPQQPILTRNTGFEIHPLIFGVDANGVDWGPELRTADHATVAINSVGDIAVAYHTTRDDLGLPPLKQVEVALFQYNVLNGNWTLVQRELLGSVIYNPLFSPTQQMVKCERPDVIAVGDRFFVVWTRRYDRSFPNQAMEPAVLECAWIRWNGSSFQVFNDASTVTYPDGLGLELDRNYHVRECAGVPDAVLLDAGDATHLPTVGVVYPHQTDFGDDPNSLPPNDGTRLSDLRLVTSTIDSAGVIAKQNLAAPLIPGTVFDGPSNTGGDASAGLVLPDCAPATIPDLSANPRIYRFWLTYEEQFFPGATVPDGRIRLKFMEGPLAGPWTALATQTFGVMTNPFVRRRPNVSSYPAGAPTMDVVSIGFNKTSSGSGDVIFEEWNWDEQFGLSKVLWPPGTGFVNDPGGVPVDDIRPIPLHGRTIPLVRRCYVDRNTVPCQIIAYDLATNATTVKAFSLAGLGRPATSYRFNSVSGADEFVLAWEQVHSPATYSRIWVQVE